MFCWRSGSGSDEGDGRPWCIGTVSFLIPLRFPPSQDRLSRRSWGNIRRVLPPSTTVNVGVTVLGCVCGLSYQRGS